MEDNSTEINAGGFYADMHNYRHFALVVTDDEIGGIQQIRIDDEKAIEIWELTVIGNIWPIYLWIAPEQERHSRLAQQSSRHCAPPNPLVCL